LALDLKKTQGHNPHCTWGAKLPTYHYIESNFRIIPVQPVERGKNGEISSAETPEKSASDEADGRQSCSCVANFSFTIPDERSENNATNG
jgi:hypothetical protein